MYSILPIHPIKNATFDKKRKKKKKRYAVNIQTYKYNKTNFLNRNSEGRLFLESKETNLLRKHHPISTISPISCSIAAQLLRRADSSSTPILIVTLLFFPQTSTHFLFYSQAPVPTHQCPKRERSPESKIKHHLHIIITTSKIRNYRL